MKIFGSALFLLLLVAASAATKGKKDEKCENQSFKCPDIEYSPAHNLGGTVAIANRAGGSISLVDPDTLKTVAKRNLPDSGEPMYFAYSPAKNEIWVGDRANNRIVIYRMVGCGLTRDGYIDTPAGVFHTMITQRTTAQAEYPIAVTTCDIDNVIVVHDVTTRRQLGVMEPPQEAVNAGAKPHDVTTNGDYIFATFLGTGEDGPGFVASYDTKDFSLVSVIETEADPHVAVREDSYLFIAAQGGDSDGFVITVTVPDLEEVNRVQRPSPHGMFLSFDLKHLYITNISLGGDMAIEVFDAATGSLRTDCREVSTTHPVPHNPAVSLDGRRIYITHSGMTSRSNSAFRIRNNGCIVPGSERTFKTKLNPFGLFVVPPANSLIQCANQDYL